MTFHYAKCKGITRTKKNALAHVGPVTQIGEIRPAYVLLCQCSAGHQQQSTKSHEDREEGDLAADSDSIAKAEPDSGKEGFNTS